MKERLQKVIAASGLMSRRAAEERIRAGSVLVNGIPAALGDQADPAEDSILVDGILLPRAEDKVYIILNKPRGYVTTMNDEHGRKTVSELVEEIPQRVYPVGRLDMDSEGLLIMTNDGELAQHLMHPSHEVTKTYRTWVKGQNLIAAAGKLREPMELDGVRLHPAIVEVLENKADGGILDITIHEGRNRQVRRMCETAGLRVTKLCRIREGQLSLGRLKTGAWRRLTNAEIRALKEE